MLPAFPATKRRAARPSARRPGVGFEPSAPENLPSVIQGKSVDSVEEARGAIALEIIGWSYTYKAQFFGGRSTPGGVEVDLLVATYVLQTPLRVMSRYYHLIRKDGTKDIYDFAKLKRIPGLAEPQDIWDYQLQSLEQAVRELRAMLGSP